MTKKTQILLGLFLLICSWGCEKEIEYKGDALDNFLVLNANLKKDSLIKCHVTRSNSFLDNNDNIIKINDATVSLYKDGELLEELTNTDNGYYQSTYKTLLNSSYKIMVTHANYKTINGQTTILPSCNATCNSLKYNSQAGKIEFSIKIEDAEGDNYYRLQVYTYAREVYGGNIIEHYHSQKVNSTDPALNFNKVKGSDKEDSGFSDDLENTYSIFNDVLFEGENYNLKFSISESDNVFDYYTIIADVQCLSKDLYDYYKTVQAVDYYGDDPFVEPIQIHSNINGGAGILGSTSSNYIYLDHFVE